ncbi:MAG: type II CRISPR-associated endonuclease Cas1 [Rhodocyclaceae bacterium]|jgi:CRISPR-associated protein Cas1|nr:type II CRISPR-associated endonuclease Cas1 [Rhodocyclaceae bacterium]
MLGRVIDLNECGRLLRRERGFLVIEDAVTKEVLGRPPIDDLGALIISAHDAVVTRQVIEALSAQGVPVVFCGSNFAPVSVLWPFSDHTEIGKRLDAQTRASRPLQKRLWQSVVRQKIRNQAAALRGLGKNPVILESLLRRVRSGDPSNVEALAAKRYWRELFGMAFRRDPSLPGTNAFLNYGYAVLRSAVARAIVASGLHPGIPIHHRQAGNPFRLVDDLMEPARPLIDMSVHKIVGAGATEVDRNAKRALGSLLYEDTFSAVGVSPLMTCLHRFSLSYAQVLLGERENLDGIEIPQSWPPQFSLSNN